MGFIQWRLGRFDDAIDYFQKFVENRVYTYRATTWVNELYLEKGDSLGALNALHKNYDFIKGLISKEPIHIRSLANLSLCYDINADETIDIIKGTLERTESPDVEMWGQFYLAFLYLKNNRLEEYKH